MTFINKDAQLALSLEQQQQFDHRQYFEQQRQFEEQQHYEHRQQMEQARHQFEQQRQFEHHQQQLFEHQREIEHQQQLELVRQQFEHHQQFEQFQSEELEDQQMPIATALDSTATTTLTLNQEDNAIVGFGESIDDPKLTSSPESGIYVCPGTLPDSERSTPQIDDSGASSWAFQVFICARLM